MLETGSLALAKMVKGECEYPWRIGVIIKRIRELMELGLILVRHTFKQVNSEIDFLAN